MGAAYRSATDPEVKGLTADTLLHPGDTLRFTWDVRHRDNYTLLIVDNTGTEVTQAEIPAGGSFRYPVSLPDGLYYWKFVGLNDLWAVGKFRMKAKEKQP